MFNLNFSEPEYFHREYEIDLGRSKTQNPNVFDQCLRVTQVALPFISLYKPIGQPLALVLGVIRSINCITELVIVIKKGEKTEIRLALLQTVISVSTVASTIFAHPVGMWITTGQDLILNTSHLITAILEKDTKKALEISLQLTNNLLYLGLFFTSAPEVLVASIACQVLLGLNQSIGEFKNGNYLEGIGHLLMSSIRAQQLYVQVESLKKPSPIAVETVVLDNGKTALINAIESGNIEAVELLLKSGVDVNAIITTVYDNEKKYAITAALNKPKILELIIGAGADVNVKLSRKMTPLHYAAKSETTYEALCILLKNGADVNSTDLYGRTPLHSGIASLKIATTLLDYGANFHFLDDKGTKPLHIAYQNCNIDILKELVRRGFSLNEFTAQGANALHYACGFNSNNKLLKLNLIKYLIEENKMNVNECGKWDDGKTGAPTPFFWALRGQEVFEDDFEILNYLIEKGANLNVKIEHKMMLICDSILSRAKSQKMPNYIIQWLIGKGAN